MPKEQHRVHEHFKTVEEKYKDTKSGEDKTRIVKICNTCGRRLIYRNVEQLVAHLASLKSGLYSSLACPDVRKKAPETQKRYADEYADAKERKKNKAANNVQRKALREDADHFRETALVQSDIRSNLSNLESNVGNVENKIARFLFAVGAAPNILDHPSWTEAFNAIKKAPSSMIAPKRRKISGVVLDRINRQDEVLVARKLHNRNIQNTGYSATVDFATIHHQPLGVFLVHHPTEPEPILVSFFNTAKLISLEGGKDSVAEAKILHDLAKQSYGEGRFMIMLTSDTPKSMRAVFNHIRTLLPQLFWQPDIGHIIHTILIAVSLIQTVADALAEMVFVNSMFLGSHFMICLLMRVSSAHLGRVRILMRSCVARFAMNFFLCVNLLSLKIIIQACMTDPAYLAFLSSPNRTPAEKKDHAKLKSFVMSEEWWSHNLMVLKPVWYLLCVLRIADKGKPAPDRIYESMETAEQKLKDLSKDSGTQAAISSDIIIALNTDHDGIG